MLLRKRCIWRIIFTNKQKCSNSTTENTKCFFTLYYQKFLTCLYITANCRMGWWKYCSEVWAVEVQTWTRLSPLLSPAGTWLGLELGCCLVWNWFHKTYTDHYWGDASRGSLNYVDICSSSLVIYQLTTLSFLFSCIEKHINLYFMACCNLKGGNVKQ